MMRSYSLVSRKNGIRAREEKHQKELRQKDKSQEILLENLNSEILKSARLSQENAQLKEQIESRTNTHVETRATAPTVSSEEHRRLVEEIETLKQQLITRNVEVAPSSPKPEAVKNIGSAISEDKYHNLAEKFNELRKRYRDVSQKVKYLERKNATVMQKNKDMKESVRAWQEYADRQSGKQKPKAQAETEEARLHLSAGHVSLDDQPNIPSSPGTLASVRTPCSVADLGRSSPHVMNPLPDAIEETTRQLTSPNLVTGDGNQGSSTTVTPKARSRIEPPARARARNTGEDVQKVSSGIQRIMSNQDNHQPAHPSSSQTTVDEPIESMSRHEQLMAAEDDEDIPEFVSERSPKRKRGERRKSRFEIYTDRSSDGTPIKPYHVKEEQCSSPPISACKLRHSETMDLDDPAPNLLNTPRHNRRSLSNLTGSTDIPRQQRCSSAPLTQDIKTEYVPDKGRLVQNDPSNMAMEAPMLQEVASIEARAFSEPTEPAQAENAILRPIDLNVVNSASEEPPNKRFRQTGDRVRQKDEMLLESGETSPPLDTKLRLPPKSARARINQRVQMPTKSSPKTPQAGPVKIKTEQIPTPPSGLSRTIRTPADGAKPSKSASKSRSDPRGEPTPDRPVWTLKPPETRSSARKSRASPLKDQSRLREKPVAELSVQDFKPNPSYNQGYSYAFSETVRKRGDRMCLPGCTNPQCCGSTFRTLAEAQAPLSSSQEEVLLEDYLGEAYNNMQLTQMSSEERKELVLQARTKKMAKESGKHREAYERRRTPPGFWRVDFPTTQEQQEDRERAKEQEKLVIQERWLEAQRKGGKWIFRDE
ncbi:hypothetical protein ACJBU6_07314 [Exserohilum turcicum]